MIPIPCTHEDQVACDQIARYIPGYSGYIHQAFFKMLLNEPNVNNILILGVYHGRDMALILDLAKRWRPTRPLYVWGVDKLTDAACADWPPDKLEMNWQQAGFGLPPASPYEIKRSLQRVVGPLPDGIDFNIVQSDDSVFLEGHARHALKFDAVYLDTSHDEKTCLRQIEQVKKVIAPGAFICGDDYSDDSNAPGGNWGVKKAVNASFDRHELFGNWIWVVEPNKS